MVLITRSITNLRSVNISISIPSLSANLAPVVIAPSATLDLLSVMTEDDLIALQHYLNQLVSAGTISVAATVDTAEFESGYTGGGGSVSPGTANQLAYYASTGTSLNGLTAITAHSALASDTNGLPVASLTTDTELGYVHGVTSSIQTQIGTLVPKTTTVNGHALSSNVTVTSSDVNALDLTTGGTVLGTVTFDKALAFLVFDRSSLDSPISLDARLVTNVDVNVDGDLTINGPTSGTEMQKITFQLRESGHAVTFATGSGNFLFNTTFPSFTASASGTDYVEATWNPDANNWIITKVVKA